MQASARFVARLSQWWDFLRITRSAAATWVYAHVPRVISASRDTLISSSSTSERTYEEGNHSYSGHSWLYLSGDDHRYHHAAFGAQRQSAGHDHSRSQLRTATCRGHSRNPHRQVC